MAHDIFGGERHRLDALDPALGIDWGAPAESFLRSPKDLRARSWESYAANPLF